MNASNPMTETVTAPTSPSKTAALLAHPGVRIAGWTLSYLATAVAGWHFGKKLENAYQKRADRKRGYTHVTEVNDSRNQSHVAQA